MGKGGLKAALKTQQSRLKYKERAQKAAHAAELKGKKPDRNTKTGNRKAHVENLLPNQKPTIPFQPTDTILLIGEGNFSFAHALVVNPPLTGGLEHLPPGNVTATAYDTEEECYDKYPGAKEIVKMLRERGVEVLFGVDATRLEKVAGLKGRKWDRIVWNFPHAGAFLPDSLLFTVITSYRSRYNGSGPKHTFQSTPYNRLSAISRKNAQDRTHTCHDETQEKENYHWRG